MSVVNYSELDYKRPKKDKYLFPTWAVGIGWGMASLSAIWIPIVIIYRLAKNGVSGEVRISKLDAMEGAGEVGHGLPLGNMDPNRYHLQAGKERSERRGTYQ